jgi:hypothetical protein
MKYFTKEWWTNGCDPLTVCDDYKAYIDSVRGALPEQVLRFIDGHMLHDSVVRELSVQAGDETARIAADGWDVNLEKSVDYELEYAGVVAVTIRGDGGESRFGPGGLGHLGYDEFEPLQSGVVEHRLLFSSGVEIYIRFRAFRFFASPGHQH